MLQSSTATRCCAECVVTEPVDSTMAYTRVRDARWVELFFVFCFLFLVFLLFTVSVLFRLQFSFSRDINFNAEKVQCPFLIVVLMGQTVIMPFGLILTSCCCFVCDVTQGFFRRSIQQKIHYRPCLKNQLCLITRVNRNRCQYCRSVLLLYKTRWPHVD
jgi:Zinc finger, C4 type (two domains)